MDQRHRGAGLGETVSCFNAEKPAADHDGARAAVRSTRNGRDVAHVAERHHAGQIGAGDGQANSPRTGGEDELGEWQRHAVRQAHGARGHVHGRHAGAVAQGDAAIAPPGRGLERNVVRRNLAGQHRRQQHAIVSKPRFLTDYLTA